MEPAKDLDYGTTAQPVAAQKRSSGKVAVAVVSAVLCAAVLAVSFSTGSSKINAVVNKNRGTSNDLEGYFTGACDNKAETRYVIATFNEASNEIIPCQQAAATDHWEQDFNDFKAALSTCASLSKIGAAFAVYNMPVWSDVTQADYDVYSTFVRYGRPSSEISVDRYAATFLGSVLVAAQCAAGEFNIVVEDTFSYKNACAQLEVDGKMCEAVEDIECPYLEGPEDGPENPCQTDVCKTVVAGGSFAGGSSGLGEACCDEIETWCETNTVGCGTFQMKHIYRNHCDESYEGAGEGAVTYFHPTLVKEQEAIAEAAEQAAEDNEVAVDGDDAGDDEGDEDDGELDMEAITETETASE